MVKVKRCQGVNHQVSGEKLLQAEETAKNTALPHEDKRKEKFHKEG